jgi:hypothetical protein
MAGKKRSSLGALTGGEDAARTADREAGATFQPLQIQAVTVLVPNDQ